MLIVLYSIRRMPGNPITDRGAPENEIGIAIEMLQAVFIGLAATVIVMEKRMKRLDKKTARDST